MNSLESKNVLVTGGGSGIGLAICREFAALGANVAIHYHTSRDAAEQLARSIQQNGHQSCAISADLTDEAQVEAMFEQISTEFGYLDVLVNNAGELVGRRSVEQTTPEFYRKVMAVNMDSVVMVTRRALPLMADRGAASIVNVSSEAGRRGGGPGSFVYAAAKGAMLAWTRTLANELARYQIRVNAVAPGMVLGSRFHEIHTPTESQKRVLSNTPVGRLGLCEDVARAVAFLASEYNGFITGATLDINGGNYMA